MKKVWMVALCICVVFVFAACAPAPAASEAPQSEAPAAQTEDQPAVDAATESAPAENAGGLKKVGVTFGDLSNPVWADCANYMMEAGGEYGMEVSVMGCKDSQEQITQIENFITSGCEGIVIGAKDAASLDAITKEAMDKGIAVFALGYPIKNFTAEMMVDNYNVGYSAAKMAAEWINEKFENGTCEVLINEFPEIDVLVERVKGMTDALAELAPNAKVVSLVSGTTTDEVLPKAENAFTANPNIKVCVCIGDGGALACKEAAKGMGLVADDFGIFGVDCTENVASAINDGNLIRGAVSLGGGKLHATTIMSVMQKIFNGEEYPKSTPYPETLVTTANVKEVSKELGYNIG